MSDATLLQEETKVSTRQEPVKCSKGHLNTPYPGDGRCVECGIYLDNNPDVFTPDSAAEGRKVRSTLEGAREKTARRLLEDEGIPWDNATEGLRQLAMRYIKDGNNKTLELLLQQVGALKAKPKPGEEATELKYEVSLTAGSVEDLKRSLSDLEEVLG